MYPTIHESQLPDVCGDPNRLVVVEDSPEYPTNLLFQAMDNQKFLSVWREWISRYMCINELFMLTSLVDMLEEAGMQVVFLDSCKPVLKSYERWSTPIDIEGFTCPGGGSLYPFQWFTLNRALEKAYNVGPEERLFFAGWCAGAGKSLFACAGAQELYNRDMIDVALCFSLMPMKRNLAYAAKASFAQTTALSAAVVEGTKTQRKKLYDQEHDVYVLNYEKMWADFEMLKEITADRRVLWIFDEALALDTPVLTQGHGWRTVRDVEVGDHIPGSTDWVRVVRKTDVFEGQRCFEVSFQGGEKVVCSANHVWTVLGARQVSKGRWKDDFDVRTDELPAILKAARHWNRALAVPVPEGVEYPDRPLLVDPYVLGYWLGDGDATGASISVHVADRPHLKDRLENAGYVVTNEWEKGLYVTRLGATTTNGESFRSQLAALGLLGNKHIPGEYLHSSRKQRLELLRGLMDADGHAYKTSTATFTQKPGPLLDAVQQLIRSLGIHFGQRIIAQGVVHTESPAVQLSWVATTDLNPFSLARKADLVIREKKVVSKKIMGVREVDPVPVQCLEVDAADHLFAVGKQWTLTHNCQKVVTAETTLSRRTKTRKHLDKLVRGSNPIVWPMSASVVGANPLRYRDVYNLAGTDRNNPLGTVEQFEARYASKINFVPLSRWTEVKYYQWNLGRLHEVRHRVNDRTQSARKTDPGVREFFKGNKLEQVPIQMSPETRKLYEALVDDARQFRRNSPEESLMGHYRLLQYVCNTPLALTVTADPIGQTFAERYPKLVNNAHNEKLNFFLDQIEAIAEQGDKVIAFTKYTNLGLHLIAPEVKKRGIKHVLHWGVGQSNEESQEAQRRFKEDDEITLFLSSDAGATGLSLPEAKYCISYEPCYSYDLLMQRSERINRADSEHDTTTYVYLTEGTIEEHIWEINEERRKLAAATLGTTETLTYGGRANRSEEANVAYLIFGESGSPQSTQGCSWR